MALRSVTVESFSHQVIGDIDLDTERLPFRDGFLRGSVPLAIEEASDVPADGTLSSPGDYHGRSYELAFGTPSEALQQPRALWCDRYGNLFTTLTTKGNNCTTEPNMTRSQTAPSGFIPYGLQEGDAIGRVARASQLMRAAGIDTEWPVRYEEPTRLYCNGEPTDPAEYRRNLKLSMLARAAFMRGKVVVGPDHLQPPTEKDVLEMSSALDKMDFFVTVRALAIAERFPDIIEGNELQTERLGKIFATYNLIAPRRSQLLASLGLPDRLTIDPNRTDPAHNYAIYRYLTEVLPKLTAHNMAQLHNLGLVHVFPHAGNITGLGGLVDLDSVKGAALGLGDEPCTTIDYARDIRAVSDIFGSDYEHVQLFLESADQSFTEQAVDTYNRNLLKTYFATRQQQAKTMEDQQDLLELAISLSEDETADRPAAEALRALTYEAIGEVVFSEEALQELAQQRDFGTDQLIDHLYTIMVADYTAHVWYSVEASDEPFPYTRETLLKAFREWASTCPNSGEAVYSVDEARADDNTPLTSQLIYEEFLDGLMQHAAYDLVDAYVKENLNTIQQRLALTVAGGLSRDGIFELYRAYYQPRLVEIARHGLPSSRDFWRTMEQKFCEQHLNHYDFLPIPKQTLLHADIDSLSPFLDWQTYHNNQISSVYTGVSPELWSTAVEPTFVASTSELGSVLRGRNEAIRVIMTDAAIENSWVEGDQDGADVLEATDLSNRAGHEPTYAIFLLQDNTTKAFRMVHKVRQAARA